MQKVSKIQFMDGMAKLERMVESATDRHTPVVRGYLERLVAVAPPGSAELFLKFDKPLRRLNLYPIVENTLDGGHSIAIFTPPQPSVRRGRSNG